MVRSLVVANGQVLLAAASLNYSFCRSFLRIDLHVVIYGPSSFNPERPSDRLLVFAEQPALNACEQK
jgi:hypothetical protein